MTASITRGRGGPPTGSVENTGTLLHTPGGYFAQFSIGGGRRKGVLLAACDNEGTAKRRQVAIAGLVAQLREAGYPAMIPNVNRDAGAADEDEFRNIAKVVERVATGKSRDFRGFKACDEKAAP